MTTINEILEKEKNQEVEFWYNSYRAQQKERMFLEVRVQKLEMILEVLARHNQLPDLAYELVPELRKPSQE